MKVTCFMMSSLDGKIDCAMTEFLPGTDDYYDILKTFNFNICISGKKTAINHYAKDNSFISRSNNSVNKKTIYKSNDLPYYDVIVDSKGTLRWNKDDFTSSLIVALPESVKEDYLDYLKSLGISYIVTGKTSIDLKDLLSTLVKDFHAVNIGIVGGGKINASFLKENLINEISLLIGPGIDGRNNQPVLFEGLNNDKPVLLKLTSCKTYPNGAVLLNYSVK